MILATVTATSPLAVRVEGAATATAARLMARGDTFTLSVADRVLCLQASGRLYVVGLA